MGNKKQKENENKHYKPASHRKLWIIPWIICLLNIFYALSKQLNGTVFLIYQYIWTYFHVNTFVYNLILNDQIVLHYANMLLFLNKFQKLSDYILLWLSIHLLVIPQESISQELCLIQICISGALYLLGTQ